jgi:diguanylate cyclase (GGDEF)-like protein
VDVAHSIPETVSVLLVEDDPEHARLVGDLLAEAWTERFEVFHVSRLEDALRHLAQDSPDCVLLDLSLPDARGLEAPAEIHTLGPDIPIVILSGLDDEPLALRAVHEGAQDYLVKGHTDAKLLGRSILYAIERKRGEIETSRDVLWDSLTGLPNRTLFFDRLKQALLRQKQRHSPLAVLFVDLQDFGRVNKVAGRAVGDELLAAVGARLRAEFRERDTTARYGSDKFAAVCENASNAVYRAELIRRIRRRIRDPFVLEGRELSVDARIGIAVSRTGETEPQDLIEHAQASVQLAKERAASLGLNHMETPI